MPHYNDAICVAYAKAAPIPRITTNIKAGNDLFLFISMTSSQWLTVYCRAGEVHSLRSGSEVRALALDAQSPEPVRSCRPLQGKPAKCFELSQSSLHPPATREHQSLCLDSAIQLWLRARIRQVRAAMVAPIQERQLCRHEFHGGLHRRHTWICRHSCRLA
jgi:hypothetical protein